MKLIRILILCATLAAIALPALAAEMPINLSLITPISIAKETDSVSGFRFNLIYGKNTSVRVIDLGLVNHTTSGLSEGLGWGLVNLAAADFKGIQLGTANIVGGNFEGFEWGFVNHAQHARGLQLGFINFARTMHGVQVGLINVITQDGFMPFFPFVNWSF
jgi:hypothetical protein